MTALDSGDNLGAAARFSTFLSAHPGDARCQDAAYLRVIALQRTGDAGSMKEAAAQYLRRYPNGFRRAEVAELAH
jgi:TolA-binding protein